MPTRLMHTYELFAKVFPYIIGLGVNFLTFKDAVLRIVITCVSMLTGALFVHYLRPYFIKKINNLIRLFKK